MLFTVRQARKTYEYSIASQWVSKMQPKVERIGIMILIEPSDGFYTEYRKWRNVDWNKVWVMLGEFWCTSFGRRFSSTGRIQKIILGHGSPSWRAFPRAELQKMGNNWGVFYCLYIHVTMGSSHTLKRSVYS